MAAAGITVTQQWATVIVGLDDTVYYAIRCSDNAVLTTGAVYATVYTAAIAALPAGNGVIIDKSGQQSPNPKVCRYATGARVECSNSGHSTGTGAEQTIPHGLPVTPTRVRVWSREMGCVAYESTAADATNVYVTGILDAIYGWQALVE